MQKIAIAGLSGLILCSLAACGNANQNASNPNTSNQNASKYAAYPYEATIDDNSDILILAKNEEALNRFIDKSVSAEIESTFSDCEQGTVLESGDALVIENAEFENCMGSEEYSKVHIKVRNKSGKSGTILNLNVDFIDKNGDIVSSTYPQYGSVVENGQACTMDVLFKGVPYGIRIASANITPMENNQTTNDRIEVYFESPFVAVNPNPGK